MNLIGAVNHALHTEMKEDENVVVLGEDVGVDGGVFRATKGLLKKFGKARVMDTPLAESGIIGTSIGMAAFGLRPVPEIQFVAFLQMGFSQLVNHAARIRNRSRGRFSCPLTVRTPFGGGIRALELHSESPEAFYVHAPGIKVVVPSNPFDAKGLLISSIRDADPVVFMEPSRIYRAVKGEVPEKPYTVPLGKAGIVRKGNELTLISWGAMLQQCKIALKYTGIDVELVDVRTLNPVDWETIIGSVKKTGKAVIVQEAPKTGGFGSELTRGIVEKAMLSLEAPIGLVAGPDVPFPLYRLENDYLPGAERIARKIEETAGY